MCLSGNFLKVGRRPWYPHCVGRFRMRHSAGPHWATAWESPRSFQQVCVQARVALERARLIAGVLLTPGEMSSRQVSVWAGGTCE